LDLIIQDISLYMVLNKFQLLELLTPTRIQGSDIIFLSELFCHFLTKKLANFWTIFLNSSVNSTNSVHFF